MIKNIIEVLKVAKGQTEYIRIAQGKFKIPQTIKESFKQIKQEVLWQNR